MKLISAKDSIFLDMLKHWLVSEPEILVLFRFSHAAGNKEFQLFTSFEALHSRLLVLSPLTSVIAFKEPQLPIRGIVDAAFIEKCLSHITDGSEYLMIELLPRAAGRISWFYHRAGVTHAELREDLEESSGASVAAGLYPPWLYDNENVISAVTPDAAGVIRSGIY